MKKRVKKLALSRELVGVAGGSAHRTSLRCHEETIQYCSAIYSLCGQYTCNNTDSPSCGPAGGCY